MKEVDNPLRIFPKIFIIDDPISRSTEDFEHVAVTFLKNEAIPMMMAVKDDPMWSTMLKMCDAVYVLNPKDEINDWNRAIIKVAEGRSIPIAYIDQHVEDDGRITLGRGVESWTNWIRLILRGRYIADVWKAPGEALRQRLEDADIKGRLNDIKSKLKGETKNGNSENTD